MSLLLIDLSSSPPPPQSIQLQHNQQTDGDKKVAVAVAGNLTRPPSRSSGISHSSLRRSRSAEPILRLNPAATNIAPDSSPSFPFSLPASATLQDDPLIINSDIPPSRAPPEIPQDPSLSVPASATLPTMIFSKPEPRRASLGPKPKSNIPMQRFMTDSPAPSTMSSLIRQQHRDRDDLRPLSFPVGSAGEHPVHYVPPSPPLTRHSTSATRSSWTSGKKSPLSNAPQMPPPIDLGLPRTSATSSGVSLKDVRKVGKHLGQTPIDYLIPNGSLPAPVSGYFHPTHDPSSLDVPPSMRSDNPNVNPVAGIFGNLNFLLDSYLAVLSSGGSIAVGTGYQSVARQLLERVEGVFARDLGVNGIGWAEVLEHLRGSRPKPFLCVLPVRGLLAKREEESVLNAEPACTTQQLAASVVAGVKAKPAMSKVNQWLEEVEQVLRAAEPDDCSKALQDEDEEEEIVCQIIEGILKNNTEESQIKNFRRYLEDRVFGTRMKLALTRLYHEHPVELITPPIVALYMLLHPEVQPLLDAIANVSEQELDLINSGRFDSFLDGSTNVVAKDEEHELNVISALDKRLWSVLEGLEDEIEELHTRALVVRRALKSRKECISTKKPSTASISSRSASPVPLPHPLAEPKRPDDERQKRHIDEEDWALNVPTLNLPITPDDSASNITFNRRRRQERAKKVHEDDHKRKKEKEQKKIAKLKKEEEKKTNSVIAGSATAKDNKFLLGGLGSTTFGKEGEDADLKSDGDTMTSRRRRKKEVKDRDRSTLRCGDCGSCVMVKDEKDMDKKRGKEKKIEEKEKRAKQMKDGKIDADSSKAKDRSS